MNMLFNCKNIKWNGIEYEELPEEEIVCEFDLNDEEDENEDDEQLDVDSDSDDE